MVTGIAVPLEAAMVASLAALALGFYAERLRHRRALALAWSVPRPAANPLSDLFAPSIFGQTVERVNRRRNVRKAARAVLSGRIDQMAMLRAGWDAESRDQVLAHIAAVMKAGVRREDSFTHIAGEGFTIVMPGADEHDAKGVAERLRRALASMTLPRSGAMNPFTASFGVAADEHGHAGEALIARARAALDAAQQTGSDHVVAASDIEEVIFLPPPEPAPAASNA